MQSCLWTAKRLGFWTFCFSFEELCWIFHLVAWGIWSLTKSPGQELQQLQTDSQENLQALNTFTVPVLNPCMRSVQNTPSFAMRWVPPGVWRSFFWWWTFRKRRCKGTYLCGWGASWPLASGASCCHDSIKQQLRTFVSVHLNLQAEIETFISHLSLQWT